MSQVFFAYSRLLRLAVMAAAILFGVVAFDGVAEAQSTSSLKRWDFLVSSGNVVPTGEQGDALQSGKLTTAQVSRQLNASTSILGTFGWARTRGAAPDNASKIDVFVYDIGAEMHTPMVGRRLTFGSFAGAGAGGRSYSHRDGGIDASHQGSLYASAGGEIGFRRVQLRAEVRDYLSRFTPFDAVGHTSLRNDIAFMLGLRLGKRQ